MQSVSFAATQSPSYPQKQHSSVGLDEITAPLIGQEKLQGTIQTVPISKPPIELMKIIPANHLILRETVQLAQLSEDNSIITQISEFPSPFLNPMPIFHLQGGIIINESALQASVEMISKQQGSLEIIRNMSLINNIKTVQKIIISKGNNICSLIFNEIPSHIHDWRYVVQRFESFGNMQFKQLADLIRQVYSDQQNSNSNNIPRPSQNFNFAETNLSLSNHCSSFSSPSVRSETVIFPQNYESATPMPSSQKRSSKGKHQFMNDIKAIENEILKAGKDALSYTFHYDSNKNLSSMHFTRAFIEKLGWEVSQFSMFCLYNGLPELLSYENYFQTLNQTLLDKLHSKVSETPYSQVYLQKIGTKIETTTKKTASFVAGGISITHQISNITNENKKIPSAPPQKVRGRKHFSQSEQNTLEYNLECPLNEMDRHQHRVCKYRVTGTQNQSINITPVQLGSC